MATSVFQLGGKKLTLKSRTRRMSCRLLLAPVSFQHKVRRFISDFDKGRLDRLAFKPFSFHHQDIPDLTAGNPG